MLQRASLRHIPRGARSEARPWALDSELEEAVEERRSARSDLRRGARTAKERWVAAKQRTASVERRVTQRHFREFVSTQLNRHQNLGRVHKTLKKWEGATDDAHRPGETTEDNGRTLTTNLEKATTFNRTYATVSRQVRVREVDRDAKARLKAQNVRTCHDCQGERSGYCSPFTADGLVSQISQAQLQKSPGPDNLCNEYLKASGPARSADASGPTECLVADWSRPARVAPRYHRPHPQGGQGSEADLQLPPHRPEFPHRQARRTHGRCSADPPHCSPQAHPTRASRLQREARSGGCSRPARPAGARWLAEDAVSSVPEEAGRRRMARRPRSSCSSPTTSLARTTRWTTGSREPAWRNWGSRPASTRGSRASCETEGPA